MPVDEINEKYTALKFYNKDEVSLYPKNTEWLDMKENGGKIDFIKKVIPIENASSN